MSNHYIIDDMINAAYINYNSKTILGISYQAGLRFEQSYYKGTIKNKNQSFSYNYPSMAEDLLKSIFPGGHNKEQKSIFFLQLPFYG